MYFHKGYADYSGLTSIHLFQNFGVQKDVTLFSVSFFSCAGYITDEVITLIELIYINVIKLETLFV